MENWKLDKNSLRSPVSSQFSCDKDTVQRNLAGRLTSTSSMLSLKVATMFWAEPNRREDLPLKLKDRNQAFEASDLYQ